jgi:hypothetical protein
MGKDELGKFDNTNMVIERICHPYLAEQFIREDI